MERGNLSWVHCRARSGCAGDVGIAQTLSKYTFPSAYLIWVVLRYCIKTLVFNSGSHCNCVLCCPWSNLLKM